MSNPHRCGRDSHRNLLYLAAWQWNMNGCSSRCVFPMSCADASSSCHFSSFVMGLCFKNNWIRHKISVNSPLFKKKKKEKKGYLPNRRAFFLKKQHIWRSLSWLLLYFLLCTICLENICLFCFSILFVLEMKLNGLA